MHKLKYFINHLMNAGRDPATTDPAFLSKLRVITQSTYALIFIGILVSIVQLIDGIPMLAFFLMLATLIGIFNLYILFNYDHITLPAHAIVIIVLVAVIMGNIQYGGFFSPNFAWFYTVILLAGLVINRAALWFYAITLAIIFCLMLSLENMGVIPINEHMLKDVTLVNIANRFMALTVFALIISAFQHIRAQYEAELKQARADAEKANASKSEFLANISHDIRTPMTGIMGMVDVLLKTELNKRQKYYLQVVKNSAAILMSLINDILDHSRLNAKKLILEPSTFNLRESLEELLILMATHAHAKGLDLTYFIPPDMPEVIIADNVRLKQILTNLLNNAIKFTHKGEIHLKISFKRSEPNVAHLKFEVIDTGIGIAPLDQKEIFKPFEQRSHDKHDHYTGAGLGLNISLALTKLLEGTLTVESTLGKGSTFTLSLPVVIPDDLLDHETISAENSNALCIALNEHDRFFLESILQNWDIHVQHTTYWPIAINLIKEKNASEHAYNFIIVDIDSLGNEGKKLIENIKDDTSDYIILHKPSENVDEAAFRKPHVHLIQKPIRQSDLFDIVVTALGKTIAGHKVPSIPSLAIKGYVNVLVAEDNVMNQHLLGAMLDNLKVDYTIVSNGMEVLEELQIKDYDLILMDCHMPLLDGFETTQRIRDMPNNKLKNIAIIALTADALEGDKRNCIEHGMNDYISKPFTENDLQNAIKKWMKGTSDAE